MANIQLNKKMYGVKSAGGIIDKSFSELFKTKEPINVNRLFELYDELFYNVPKLGDDSHTSLIQRSTDYIRDYIDPKDEVIDSLIDRIEILEEELSNDSDQEHPFFNNGSIVSSNPQQEGIYLMENGRRRSINGWELVKTIMKLQGIKENFSDEIIVIQNSTLQGIPKGERIHTEQDLNNYNYLAPTKTESFLDLRTSLELSPITEGQLIQLRRILDEKEQRDLIKTSFNPHNK